MDNKFYSLTDETKIVNGHTLRKIQAEKDILTYDKKGRPFLVEAGKKGGWIEKEENLAQDGSWVAGDNSVVYGNAVVKDGSAIVNAQVGDNAIVSNAVVASSTISGNVELSNSKITRSDLRDDVKISYAKVDDMNIDGQKQIKGSSQSIENITDAISLSDYQAGMRRDQRSELAHNMALGLVAEDDRLVSYVSTKNGKSYKLLIADDFDITKASLTQFKKDAIYKIHTLSRELVANEMGIRSFDTSLMVPVDANVVQQVNDKNKSVLENRKIDENNLSYNTMNLLFMTKDAYYENKNQLSVVFPNDFSRYYRVEDNLREDLNNNQKTLVLYSGERFPGIVDIEKEDKVTKFIFTTKGEQCLNNEKYDMLKKCIANIKLQEQEKCKVEDEKFVFHDSAKEHKQKRGRRLAQELLKNNEIQNNGR